MAHDDNVLLRVEFLIKPCWNLAHRDVLATRDLRSLVLPRFAHIQHDEFFRPVLQRLQFANRNLVFHCDPSHKEEKTTSLSTPAAAAQCTPGRLLAHRQSSSSRQS